MTKVYTLYHHTQQQQKKTNFLSCDDQVCSILHLGALFFEKTGFS